VFHCLAFLGNRALIFYNRDILRITPKLPNWDQGQLLRIAHLHTTLTPRKLLLSIPTIYRRRSRWPLRILWARIRLLNSRSCIQPQTGMPSMVWLQLPLLPRWSLLTRSPLHPPAQHRGLAPMVSSTLHILLYPTAVLQANAAMRRSTASTLRCTSRTHLCTHRYSLCATTSPRCSFR
jgi:hypothetical protein